MKAKAITFDLDDTLWPILPVIIRAEEETNTWLKNNYPAVKKIMDTSEILQIRTEILNKYPQFKNDLSKLREKSYESLGLRAGYSHQEAKKLGKVTGLEIPRFVSLKKSKTFLRRGPDTVSYTHLTLPTKA